MSNVAEHYGKLVLLNDGAFRGVSKDVSDKDARVRLDGRSSFWWIAGHLAEHRAVPLAALGGDRTSRFPLTELFGRDTTPREDAASPTLAELASEFVRFGDLLRARVTELGDSAFVRTHATPGGLEMPLPFFFHFHESYHLGQLGLLRTRLGRAPLVPPLRRKDP
jgi:hypothetical protein